MGRIADALRRAGQERQLERGRFSTRRTAVALDDPLVLSPTGADESSDAQKPSADGSVTLVEGLNEALVPYYDSSSLIAEQYRSLRTRLLSQNPQYEHRILAVTSSVPKEGKSVTTLNLGSVFAEIRHLSVLVVDGDFRRSSLAKKLNQPNGPGLAEVLAGEATYSEVIRSTPIPNLNFIPAGSTQHHSAAELLASSAAKPLFRRMLNDYHYTLIDTPPATTVSDVGVIGQLCSGVILVVRLHRTDEGAAKRSVRLLQSNNIPIVGCLLIGRDAPGGRYGFGYGQGYRYYDYYGKGKNDS